MYKRRISTTLLGILLAVHVASSIAAPTTPTKAREENTSSRTLAQAEEELELLRSQVSSIKDYHQTLLDTVYWALATVVTLSVLFAGFNWFANFKLYESDKKRLQDELETRLSEANANLEKHLATRLASNEIELLKSVDARLESVAARLTRELENNRADIGKDLANLRTEFSNRTDQQVELLKSTIATITKLQTLADMGVKKIMGVEADLRQVEELIWEMKGIPVNVLITQGQGLRAATSAENEYQVKSVLARMKRSLQENLLPAKQVIAEALIKSLIGDVAAAEKYDPITVAEVRQLLSQVPLQTTS